MDQYESLSHTKWECKYHVVFIPKGRRRTLYAHLRRYLGDVFRRLAEQKESQSDTSKAKAPFILPGCMEKSSAISSGNISGHAGILSPQSGEMRRRSARTSATKSRRISVLTNSICCADWPPCGGP
jgi:hypothetical protein